MDAETITQLSRYLISVTFMASLLFCVMYAMLADWYHNEFGMALMLYQLSMTGVLGLSVLSAFIGPHMWITYIGLVVLSLVPVSLVGRTWIMIKMWRANRDSDE